jgi:hypothetical protein
METILERHILMVELKIEISVCCWQLACVRSSNMYAAWTALQLG